ncbi:MAG: hypothetical protein GF383_13545, partial [Candidatus Lokiarchaeota archaeon]|nr:hypothetical protein [Candidatus Lokiarchaeota archaeon]MBD3342249.1 hypothetical protein [Candidatus Lokiarchaeota archaeon]
MPCTNESKIRKEQEETEEATEIYLVYRPAKQVAEAKAEVSRIQMGILESASDDSQEVGWKLQVVLC